jgi:hypothetical protein
MQRLFSMFPVGAPGAALLLLRLSLGSTLFNDLHNSLELLPTPYGEVQIGVAALLGLGLLTPLAAIFSIAFAIHTLAAGGILLGSQVIALALALALIGPGGYSLDARFFGRRRVVFDNQHKHFD